jgi:hypothetical protein
MGILQTNEKHGEQVLISPNGNVKDLLAAMSADDHDRASTKDDKDEEDDRSWGSFVGHLTKWHQVSQNRASHPCSNLDLFIFQKLCSDSYHRMTRKRVGKEEIHSFLGTLVVGSSKKVDQRVLLVTSVTKGKV